MTDTENDSKKERLSNKEFLELIPHLPLQDLLLTEYRVDADWTRLVQLHDSSKKLYGCCICNVVQYGIQNLYAHVDGKKHKLKMGIVKQLYQPKYTYGKLSTREISSKTLPIKEILTPTKLDKNVTLGSTENTRSPSYDNESNNLRTWDKKWNTCNENKTISYDKNEESAQTVREFSVAVNKEDINLNQTEMATIYKNTNSPISTLLTDCNEFKSAGPPTKNNGDENVGIKFVLNPAALKVEKSLPDSEKFDSENTSLALIVIEDDSQEKFPAMEYKTEAAIIHTGNEIDEEPPLKKIKTVLNPAAIKHQNVKVYENISNSTGMNLNNGNPLYQSNITIIPTKCKPKQNTDQHSIHSSQHKFTNKMFSSNPLDDVVYGLVGVEYVIKIMKEQNDCLPKYECGLCEIVQDGFGMQTHLMGYSHRIKFCEKHFPTALRQYRQYIRKVPPNEMYKIMAPILQKLAVAIEEHHGRELPYECLECDFNINRHEILSKVFSCRHASEQYGPAFTHIIDSKEVDKLIASLDKYQPLLDFPNHIAFDLCANTTTLLKRTAVQRRSYVPNLSMAYPKGYRRQNLQSSVRNDSIKVVPNDRILDNGSYKLLSDDFSKSTRKKIRYSRKDHIKFKQICPRSRYISTSAAYRTQLESQRKSLSPLRYNDVWQAYRHIVDQKVTDLNEIFQLYRRNPETHPAYDREWQTFWKRRKRELYEAGLDHRTYNYQPEWVRFFNIRIQELYNQAVKDIKIDARKRLYLPMTNENQEREKYFVYKNNLNVNPNFDGEYDEYVTKEVSNIIPDCSKKPEIVSVLRLLTALEEHLGSLGPKIVELLSKTLQAEKNNPNELNAIILTNDNYAILETAMEKFKGLIISGILDDTKQRVLTKAIAAVDNLLKLNYNFTINMDTFNITDKSHFVSNYPAVPKKLNESCSNDKKLLTNILSQVNKKELAMKLASVLASQGKTHVDPEQLQKIISVYMLIEKKKSETSANCIPESSSGHNVNPQNMPITANESNNFVDISINNQGSWNYGGFHGSSSYDKNIDRQIFANKYTNLFQTSYGHNLGVNSSGTIDTATSCNTFGSNMSKNTFSINNQSHINKHFALESQQINMDIRQQNAPLVLDRSGSIANSMPFLEYNTVGANQQQGYNMRNNNWNGNNSNWRKF